LLKTKTRRKLFVFYGSILVSVVFGAIIGLLFNLGAGMFAGAFIGLFAGALAGVLAGDGLGAFIGLFTGVLAGGFAGALASAQGYEIALQYLIFLVAVCAACLVIIHIGAFIKKHLPAIKEWLGG